MATAACINLHAEPQLANTQWKARLEIYHNPFLFRRLLHKRTQIKEGPANPGPPGPLRGAAARRALAHARGARAAARTGVCAARASASWGRSAKRVEGTDGAVTARSS